ncbi:MAG TPA: GntR family transcriptional regulator [Pseudonocardia sp.]|jgi:GntR family transcriptional regulator|uniref:GntR family transcriptional regulator n=1 Tax=Pseudonocardia sp. TaxID=60912 RepID=UPI002F3EDA5E
MKYLRLRDELLERVAVMEPGEPLPPERELAAEIGVSRTTLRRALAELVSAGALRSRPGAGMFAVGPKIAQGLTATSFTEDMLARGLRPGARLVSFTVIPAGARLGRRLELSPSEEVLRVLRVRLADDEPMAVELLHVPAQLVPGLDADLLSGASFYQLLAQRYGLSVAGGRQSIEPTVTDREESNLLGVALHSPALLFERTSRDAGGRVLEFVRSVYRGDRYRIETAITPSMVQPSVQA